MVRGGRVSAKGVPRPQAGAVPVERLRPLRTLRVSTTIATICIRWNTVEIAYE